MEVIIPRESSYQLSCTDSPYPSTLTSAQHSPEPGSINYSLNSSLREEHHQGDGGNGRKRYQLVRKNGEFVGAKFGSTESIEAEIIKVGPKHLQQQQHKKQRSLPNFQKFVSLFKGRMNTLNPKQLPNKMQEPEVQEQLDSDSRSGRPKERLPFSRPLQVRPISAPEVVLPDPNVPKVKSKKVKKNNSLSTSGFSSMGEESSHETMRPRRKYPTLPSNLPSNSGSRRPPPPPKQQIPSRRSSFTSTGSWSSGSYISSEGDIDIPEIIELDHEVRNLSSSLRRSQPESLPLVKKSGSLKKPPDLGDPDDLKNVMITNVIAHLFALAYGDEEPLDPGRPFSRSPVEHEKRPDSITSRTVLALENSPPEIGALKSGSEIQSEFSDVGTVVVTSFLTPSTPIRTEEILPPEPEPEPELPEFKTEDLGNLLKVAIPKRKSPLPPERLSGRTPSPFLLAFLENEAQQSEDDAKVVSLSSILEEPVKKLKWDPQTGSYLFVDDVPTPPVKSKEKPKKKDPTLLKSIILDERRNSAGSLDGTPSPDELKIPYYVNLPKIQIQSPKNSTSSINSQDEIANCPAAKLMREDFALPACSEGARNDRNRVLLKGINPDKLLGLNEIVGSKSSGGSNHSNSADLTFTDSKRGDPEANLFSAAANESFEKLKNEEVEVIQEIAGRLGKVGGTESDWKVFEIINSNQESSYSSCPGKDCEKLCSYVRAEFAAYLKSMKDKEALMPTWSSPPIRPPEVRQRQTRNRGCRSPDVFANQSSIGKSSSKSSSTLTLGSNGSNEFGGSTGNRNGRPKSAKLLSPNARKQRLGMEAGDAKIEMPTEDSKSRSERTEIELFLLSLAPTFERINDVKAEAKIKMQFEQILYKAEFGDNQQ